jgi:hypothetical protein
MPPIRNNCTQTACRSTPLPSLQEGIYSHITQALEETRNYRSSSLNLASHDLGHFVLNRREVIQRMYDTAQRLEIWHEYEIRHQLHQKCAGWSTQRIKDLTNLDRHEQHTAKKIHQVLCHCPEIIAHINYVKVQDFTNLSGGQTDELEQWIAQDTDSWIVPGSQYIDPLWNPILQDTPDQWLQTVTDLFEGPPIRIDAPMQPHHIPYFDGPRRIRWRSPTPPNQEPPAYEEDDFLFEHHDMTPDLINFSTLYNHEPVEEPDLITFSPMLHEDAVLPYSVPDLDIWSDNDDFQPMVLNFTINDLTTRVIQVWTDTDHLDRHSPARTDSVQTEQMQHFLDRFSSA